MYFSVNLPTYSSFIRHERLVNRAGVSLIETVRKIKKALTPSLTPRAYHDTSKYARYIHRHPQTRTCVFLTSCIDITSFRCGILLLVIYFNPVTMIILQPRTLRLWLAAIVSSRRPLPVPLRRIPALVDKISDSSWHPNFSCPTRTAYMMHCECLGSETFSVSDRDRSAAHEGEKEPLPKKQYHTLACAAVLRRRSSSERSRALESASGRLEENCFRALETFCHAIGEIDDEDPVYGRE